MAPSFKAIEIDGTTHQRTGREFQFETETRQATIDALLAQLAIPTDSARVDPSRTLVQVGDMRWSIMAISERTAVTESSGLRRGGAKHKQVR